MLLFGWHVWRGESGRRYRFNITLTDGGLPDAGGVYVFVRRRFVFFLEPLYVGKATNFQNRLLGHERWSEAWWSRGATERHIMRVKDARERARREEDLIRALKPVMNNQLVPRGAGDAPVDARLRRAWTLKRCWEAAFGRNRSQRCV